MFGTWHHVSLFTLIAIAAAAFVVIGLTAAAFAGIRAAGQRRKLERELEQTYVRLRGRGVRRPDDAERRRDSTTARSPEDFRGGSSWWDVGRRVANDAPGADDVSAGAFDAAGPDDAAAAGPDDRTIAFPISPGVTTPETAAPRRGGSVAGPVVLGVVLGLLVQASGVILSFIVLDLALRLGCAVDRRDDAWCSIWSSWRPGLSPGSWPTRSPAAAAVVATALVPRLIGSSRSRSASSSVAAPSARTARARSLLARADGRRLPRRPLVEGRICRTRPVE